MEMGIEKRPEEKGSVRCDRCGHVQPIITKKGETRMIRDLFELLSLNGLGILCFYCKPDAKV
jgi:hypothetical protein